MDNPCFVFAISYLVPITILYIRRYYIRGLGGAYQAYLHEMQSRQYDPNTHTGDPICSVCHEAYTSSS